MDATHSSAAAAAEFDMCVVHPWVGSGWVTKFLALGALGWAGSSVKNI